MRNTSSPQVLVVDDDPHFAALLAFELGEHELDVETAASAEHALRVLDRGLPDLIVSDVRMPGLDGPELRRHVSRLGPAADVPFVFVTGGALPGRLPPVRPILAKESGIDAVVDRVESLLAARVVGPRPAESRTVVWRRGLRRLAWALRDPLYRLAKRTLDIVVAASALLLLSPLLLTVAAWIRLEDHGPALFHQTRVGRGGRTFRFYKFRSMRMDAEAVRAEVVATGSDDGDATRFKQRRDPRITRIGRFIRRSSIDELPQLWNVLRGDMTLVGPRPPIPSETSQYSLRAWRRLDVTPGLTCEWQVGGRSDVPFPEQVELDIGYIRRRSLLRDLSLLFRTIPAVLTGRGAY